jgi:transcriptional regulator with XRE-family HTH domain
MKGRSVIAKRLREARLRAGLSQKMLGIKAGIDEFSASPRINQYETGKHTPDYSTVERLAVVLGVPTPFLYTRDDWLAELILRTANLSVARRRRLIESLEK